MSLAVKYRPSTLDQLIGQQAVISSLQGVLKRPVVPHSYLFMGASGTGKTTLARILAARFAGDGFTSQNVIEIDAATNSGADAIRQVVSQAQYRAISNSPIKTIIVDEVHRLSSAAWSSLLKPIEEPPPHVYWCLCTTEIGKIPETIKTRCVTFTLNPVDELLIFDLLKDITKREKIEIDQDILEIITETSNGSVRQALSNLELCLTCKNINEARNLIKTAAPQGSIIELARLLIAKKKVTWETVVKIIRDNQDLDPESIRIVISNYLAGCLMKAKTDNEAVRLLAILERFSEPYTSTDKLAPLLLSVGLALSLDRN